MRILVIGSGGREHALAWKASLSPAVSGVFVAPGNAGTAGEPGVENVAIAVDDHDALVRFAAANDVALTIVGPEAPLVDGIVDVFAANGLHCFGPGSAAARLEGSKAFAKEFMQRHGIPAAASETFSDLVEARAHVRAQGAPIVIKADGLAAGKGVTVARSEEEAFAALDAMLAGGAFGSAGERVVVEEFLQGEEASFTCLCDGRTALPFASSQDHKAVEDGDKGPNTGGMGAYSPAPVVTDAVHRRIVREIVEPTMAGMAADGSPYVGFLYVGLMISPEGVPRVIEFNCRFGDPEAQPVMMRLRSDLPALCLEAVTGGLQGKTLDWDPRVALGVVMAAGGYPGGYAKGAVVTGLDGVAGDDVKVFHAGTEIRNGKVLTDGGRVLCVAALGDNATHAQQKAYEGVAAIDWQDAYWRTDIGYRAVAREQGE